MKVAGIAATGDQQDLLMRTELRGREQRRGAPRSAAGSAGRAPIIELEELVETDAAEQRERDRERDTAEPDEHARHGERGRADDNARAAAPSAADPRQWREEESAASCRGHQRLTAAVAAAPRRRTALSDSS